MLSYTIDTNLQTDKYGAVIYALSYTNPLHDINNISSSLRKKKTTPSYILFDLLLSNGVNFNRFVEGYFDGQIISFDSLNIVELDDRYQVERINAYYQKNPSILNGGVLTASERMRFARRGS